MFVSRTIQTILISLFLGIVYLQIPESACILGHIDNDIKGVRNRISAMFFILMNESYTALYSDIAMLSKDLPVVFVESGDGESFLIISLKGMYRLDAYFAAITTVAFPLSILFPTIFCLIAYYLIGFQFAFSRFLGFLGSILLVTNCAAALGQLIAAATGNFSLASSLTTVVTLPIILLGGFYLQGLRVFWFLKWIRYVSFFYWGYKLLILNQFHGVHFECTPNLPCPYPDDKAVLEAFNVNEYDISIAVPLLIGMNIVLRILAMMCFELRGYAAFFKINT